MLKRTSSIFIIAALLVVVSIDAKAQRAPSYGGTLIISGSQPMYSLDPTAAEHDEEYLFADLVYSNLTKLKSDYTPEPELAENWKSSKSGDHWIFELRKGVKWHNGKELTADDVVYSLTRAKQPGTTTQSLIKAIDSVEALDQYTVKINMNSVYPDIPSTLASPHLSILPKWNKHFATVPIGTGPFKVSQIIPGESVMVSKFDGYFEKGLPYLDAIKLVFHPDPAATIASLLAGDIDVAWNGRPEWEPLIKKNPDVELLKAPGFAHNCIEIMTDRKPFDDVRVRQAIAYTIDREMLVATVLIGHGIPASDSPMPPANPYYNSEIPLRKQDYKKARSLLEQAGYSQGLKLTLFTSESRAGQLGTALALQDMAKPAGIEIKVVNVDPVGFGVILGRKSHFLYLIGIRGSCRTKLFGPTFIQLDSGISLIIGTVKWMSY